MIEKLKTLEQTLFEVRKKYDIQLAELEKLRDRPLKDISEFNGLKAKLDETSEENQKLQASRDELQQKLIELDERYQSLAEAHHMIGEEQDRLQQQVEELTLLNKRLQDKNREAAEHTEYALRQLTRIDQAN